MDRGHGGTGTGQSNEHRSFSTILSEFTWFNIARIHWKRIWHHHYPRFVDKLYCAEKHTILCIVKLWRMLQSQYTCCFDPSSDIAIVVSLATKHVTLIAKGIFILLVIRALTCYSVESHSSRLPLTINRILLFHVVVSTFFWCCWAAHWKINSKRFDMDSLFC